MDASVRVTLQRAGTGITAQPVATWLASVTGSQGGIDLATVDHLFVTVERVEFLPTPTNGDGESNGDGGPWIPLDVEDVEIDLVALPVEGEPGITLVTTDLDPGEYRNVRLFVRNAVLWLNTPFQVGNAVYGTEDGHPVRIPSGDQTGIKTDQGFTIPDGGGDVALVFDENATLANVHGTGNGQVMLAPVLRVRSP
jgi:hypothetical protein